MTRPPRGLDRRQLLKGLSAAAASLPLLRSFPASAATAALPKLVIVGLPSGYLVGPTGTAAYQGWRPAGFTGTEGLLGPTLPPIFQPLAAHRSRLLFIEGL